MRDHAARTVLYHVVSSGNPQAVDIILALYPESERPGALLMQDRDGRTPFHCAASRGKHEMMKHILTLLPDSQRLLIANIPTQVGMTVLHDAAESGNFECIKTILEVYPEADWQQLLSVKDRRLGQTVLYRAAATSLIHHSFVCDILSLLPESQRSRIVMIRDGGGRTVLHRVVDSGSVEQVKTILSLYPESHRLQAVSVKDYSEQTVLHRAAHSGDTECLRVILAQYPESEQLQAFRPVFLDDRPVHNPRRRKEKESSTAKRTVLIKD